MKEKDILTAEERALVERACNTAVRLVPVVGQLVNILDRIAPKPPDPLDSLIARWKASSHYVWNAAAEQLEAALREIKETQP